MAALPKPQKNIRRFRIVAKDVDRVIKHIKLHGKVTKNDRITRPLKKKKRDGTLDEDGATNGVLAADLKSGPTSWCSTRRRLETGSGSSASAAG